jgi:RNA recognition motif-containing protein
MQQEKRLSVDIDDLMSHIVSDSDLDKLFSEHGTVQSAQVIMDPDTGRSKGFGFVEMGSDAEAQAAIQALSGKEVDGRALTVNEASQPLIIAARNGYLSCFGESGLLATGRTREIAQVPQTDGAIGAARDQPVTATSAGASPKQTGRNREPLRRVATGTALL